MVQGYGNAGAITARLLSEDGAIVVAVSDSKGGIYNPKGIDADGCTALQAGARQTFGLRRVGRMSNEDILELDCEILVPAALESVITEKNADRIKAKMIAEAANGPTTPEADRILSSKGIMVLPDILANAGGVTVSYFEWAQNIQGYYWAEDEVNEKLERVMKRAFRDVHDIAVNSSIDMRTGAYMLAISRVAEVTRLRGIFP